MPTVAAAYIVLRDTPVTFGQSDDAPTSDAHFQFEIHPDLGGVDTRFPAILTFRVDPIGDVTLRVRLNTEDLLEQSFDTAPQRVWQEAFPSRFLLAEGNEITMSVPEDSSGDVRVADVILWIMTTIP